MYPKVEKGDISGHNVGMASPNLLIFTQNASIHALSTGVSLATEIQNSFLPIFGLVCLLRWYTHLFTQVFSRISFSFVA